MAERAAICRDEEISKPSQEVGMDSKEILEVLIASIRGEIRLGTRHYDSAGKLLETEWEILEEIQSKGKVRAEPTPDRQQRFDLLKQEKNVLVIPKQG